MYSIQLFHLTSWVIIVGLTIWGFLWLLERDSGIPYGELTSEPITAENYPFLMFTVPRAAKVAIYGIPPGLLVALSLDNPWWYGTVVWAAMAIGYTGGHFKSLGLKSLAEGLTCAASGLLLTIPIAAVIYTRQHGIALSSDPLEYLPTFVVAFSGALKPCGYAIGWALRKDGSPWPGSFAIGSSIHGLVTGAALGWALTQ